MTKTNKSLIVAMIIAVGIVLLFQLHQSGKIKEVKKSETKIYDFNIKASEFVTLNEFNKKYEVKNVITEEEKIQRPKLNVPNLSEDKLDYLWKRTQEEDFSYELLLGIYMLESEQGTKKFHRNRNGSVDSGAFQINSGTVHNLAKEMGLRNYDIFNDYTSIDFAIQHLKDSREFWSNKGMSDEDIFDYLILSYNLGDPNVIPYLRTHRKQDNAYLKAVKHYKYLFEQSENGGN